MTKTEGAKGAAGNDMQAKVTGVKKMLANFKKKLTNIKKQVWLQFNYSATASFFQFRLTM